MSDCVRHRKPSPCPTCYTEAYGVDAKPSDTVPKYNFNGSGHVHMHIDRYDADITALHKRVGIQYEQLQDVIFTRDHLLALIYDMLGKPNGIRLGEMPAAIGEYKQRLEEQTKLIERIKNENALMAAHQGIDNYQRCLDTIEALTVKLSEQTKRAEEMERRLKQLCVAHGNLLIDHHDLKVKLEGL